MVLETIDGRSCRGTGEEVFFDLISVELLFFCTIVVFYNYCCLISRLRCKRRETKSKVLNAEKLSVPAPQ